MGEASSWYPWYFSPEFGGIQDMGSYSMTFAPTSVGGGVIPGIVGGVISDIIREVTRGTPGQLPAEAPPSYPSISKRGPVAVIDPNTGQPLTYAVTAFAYPGMKKHRHMNPCNPRALRRALCRASRFARFAKKAIRIERRFKSPRRCRRRK